MELVLLVQILPINLLQGHRVIILDNFLPQVHSGDVETIDGVKYIFGCVSDKECWKEGLYPMNQNTLYILHQRQVRVNQWKN